MNVSTKLFLGICIVVFTIGCIKEYSFETGKLNGSVSSGSLKDSLGNCQNIEIKGNYYADTTLTDSNYVLVKVNITSAGKYLISSDTANGFWFRDSGFVLPGLQTIKLKGFGKPILPLNTDFLVSYNNSVCTFQISLVAILPPSPVMRDYFPTEVGSNWAYNITGSTDTLHVEATPKDSVIGGNTYRVFVGKQNLVPNDTAYYRKNSGNYYRYAALDANSPKIEILFLKDNQPILSQWESPINNTTYQGVATQVKMRFTILGMNTTVTVNGNSIDSVIKIQNDLQYKVFGTYTTATTFNTFFAKNIGLINLDAPSSFSQTIRRWKIY
jgi:hypothetical protein